MTTTRTAHASYLRNSDTYASLYANYGARMPLARAERFAAQHGTTVADLEPDGLTVKAGTVGTLALVQALGY